MPFEIFSPTVQETPVIVEIPHAGLTLDAQSLAWTVAPARSVGRDADLYVDELYRDAPDLGATMIVARFSRLVVDLNRSELDVDADAVDLPSDGRSAASTRRAPRGLIWTLTTEGHRVLRHPISKAELSRRLDGIYRPYHRAIMDALLAKRRRFGCAVLLCAHSMPTHARRDPLDPGPRRADVVPGTRSKSTAANELIDVVGRVSRDHGLSLRHDDPYRGGFSTGHYGQPADGIHAIQIELARHLYMDEDTLAQTAGFARTQGFARDLVRGMGEAALRRSSEPIAAD